MSWLSSYMANSNVADYYNQTQQHYDRWWSLKKDMALHYGLWFPGTRTFSESLSNTNKFLADLAEINSNMRILDAGCGVGGSAVYLAKNRNCQVDGITLSEKQVLRGNENILKAGVSNLVEILSMDYTSTSFEDNTFDVVWACESLSSCGDKGDFAKEAARILKPGGRLVLSDFFRNQHVSKDEPLINEWCQSWAMAPLSTVTELMSTLEENGFTAIRVEELSAEISPTVRRLYRGYLLGAIPSKIYNFLFGASPYSRTHYQSGKFQYQSFKKGLWGYRAMICQLP